MLESLIITDNEIVCVVPDIESVIFWHLVHFLPNYITS